MNDESTGERVLALARCINSASTENALLLGEYYLIEHYCRSQYDGERRMHQDNVFCYVLPDDKLVEENFRTPATTGGYVHATPPFSTKFSQAPVYIGPRHRFELVFLPGQFGAALERAKERASSVRKAAGI